MKILSGRKDGDKNPQKDLTVKFLKIVLICNSSDLVYQESIEELLAKDKLHL